MPEKSRSYHRMHPLYRRIWNGTEDARPPLGPMFLIFVKFLKKDLPNNWLVPLVERWQHSTFPLISSDLSHRLMCLIEGFDITQGLLTRW